LRHARIERWSQGSSAIHRCPAPAKILAVLALLISIAVSKSFGAVACGALLLAIAVAAGLPMPAMLWSAATVLPFALCFAVSSALAGDSARAAWLVIRAYLSALAALLLIATTPMPDLIGGLEWLRVPRFLLQVMQFLYRYLIVLAEEATAMRQAASARGGSTGMGSFGKLRFRQSSAAAGVLFARSYARAEAVHRAMLSRGFEGRLPLRIRSCD
jgi:cobalt/nickel transport system permease protein